jgi:hypothetical protein
MMILPSLTAPYRPQIRDAQARSQSVDPFELNLSYRRHWMSATSGGKSRSADTCRPDRIHWFQF